MILIFFCGIFRNRFKMSTKFGWEHCRVSPSVMLLWYLGEVGVDSQLGQRGPDGVAGVRHSSVGAGGVRQGVGQGGSLGGQPGLQPPRPLLQDLQRGGDALQGLLGLTHGCEGERRHRKLSNAFEPRYQNVSYSNTHRHACAHSHHRTAPMTRNEMK